jgi:phosphate transport system substrate-binding protein
MRYVLMWRMAAVTCVGFVFACGGPATSGTNISGGVPATNATADLRGAGSTFAFPLYSKWADAYKQQTGVSIAYESTGSGDGVRRFSQQTIDFGGTDGPMTDSELAHAKGGTVLHVPTALGADIVAYNLPTVTVPLRFTPDVLADIFLGKITKWNDARLIEANPDAKLPAADILVVHRVDGSGTTYVWTDYLSTVSEAWAHGPGKGKEIAWPVGVDARGNDGVAGMVKQIPGAIGYIELTYAKPMGLPVGLVRNAAGRYVTPSVSSIAAAAAGVATRLPANTDYRISIVDAPGTDAYPIASFTWILVYRDQTDSAKGTRIVKFLRWALSDGQTLEAPLSYAPLPEALLSPLRLRLDSIRISGASKTVAASH